MNKNCCSLGLASNKAPHSCSITPPLGGVENGKKKAKLMGWSKDSLTEQ